MNSKQARMLRQMRADKNDVARWGSLPDSLKGKLRHFHENNEKMMHFSFQQAMRCVNTKRVRLGINMDMSYNEMKKIFLDANPDSFTLEMSSPGGMIGS